MVCTLITRALGYVKVAIFAAYFGASGQADILNAVFSIPNNFRKLSAEGALSSAFIPVLSHLIVKDPSRESAKKLTRSIITFQFLILVPLLVLGVIFAEPLMKVFLEFSDPGKMHQSADLYKWIGFYLLFISVSAVLMGVLNSHGSFVVPALAPLSFSFTVIGAILLFHQSLGIYSLAVGVLSGGVLQVVHQYPFFKKEGYDLKLQIDWRNSDFLRVLKLWGPVIITSSIATITQQVAVRFASGLDEGSTSALTYAIVFWQLPFGVFTTSIITVLFPQMSRQVASNDTEGLIKSLNYGLRYMLVLLAPATLFFVMMGREMISLAYERGAFTAAGTILTTNVLNAYSWGLYSVGAFTFLQRFFYAYKDIRTPLYLSIVAGVIDIAVSIWLKETSFRVVGLAIANTVAFTVGLFIMLYLARLKLKRLGMKKLLNTTLKCTLAVGLASLLLWGYQQLTKPLWSHHATFTNLLLLGGGFIIFVIVTLGMYFLLREEILMDIVQRRFKSHAAKTSEGAN